MTAARSDLPRRVGLLSAAVVHGALVAGATAAFRGLAEHERWDWGEFSARAGSFAVVLTAVVALQKPAQRFFGSGGAEQETRRAADRAVARAVWGGALPDDVDPVRWPRDVDRWLRQVQLGRVVYAVLVVVVGALVAVTASELDHGDRGVLALAAALVLAAPALLVATRGPVRRARQLRDGPLPVA